MWVRATRRVPDVLPCVHVEAGERVLVEVSRKFTAECGCGGGPVLGARGVRDEACLGRQHG